MGDYADFVNDDSMDDLREDQADVDVPYDEIKHETDKAYLMAVAHGNEWMPKSQIIDLNEEDSICTIPYWLAEQKGLV